MNRNIFDYSGLSFGKIDQLGRFQSDIEPDPGRNEGKLPS